MIFFCTMIYHLMAAAFRERGHQSTVQTGKKVRCYDKICSYHMGIKSPEECSILESQGHKFEEEPDLFFNDCTRQYCKFSHNRKDCISYFSTNPEEWFDYAWECLKRRIPKRFIYQPYTKISTHDPVLLQRIRENSVRPCYTYMDGVQCTNPKCKLLHQAINVTRYYSFHPDIYMNDLLFKLSRIFMNKPPNMDEIERHEKAQYINMVKIFSVNKIKPRTLISMDESDKVIEQTFNKLAPATCDEFVEATCVYMEGKPPQTVDNIIKTICYQGVWHAMRQPAISEVYFQYLRGLLKTTLVTKLYMQKFYEKIIEQSSILFNEQYEKLNGHPDFMFPDENLLPNECARVVEFLLKFVEFPPIANLGFNILKNILSNPEIDANLILTPYILKIPQNGFSIPKPVLQKIYDKVKNLPDTVDAVYRSKLRFKLMDLLE